MTPILSAVHDTKQDAERWRTLATVIAICGCAAAVFVAGMNYGKVNATADAVTKLEASAVMKDGREMAELRGSLQLITQQLNQLVNQGVIAAGKKP